MARTGDLVIALSSVPPRFGALGPRLRALLRQGADRVVLCIPRRYARFPDWGGALPPLPAGVTLLRGEDHGPATKLVEPARRWPDGDLLICDDDCDYGPGWLAAFRSARAADPEAVIAASSFDTRRLGLAPGGAVVQGFAGVLLRPRWLGGAQPDAQARWVDDVWLSAQIAAARRDVRPCPSARAAVRPAGAPAALQGATIAGLSRAELNRIVAERLARELGIWGQPRERASAL